MLACFVVLNEYIKLGVTQKFKALKKKLKNTQKIPCKHTKKNMRFCEIWTKKKKNKNKKNKTNMS